MKYQVKDILGFPGYRIDTNGIVWSSHVAGGNGGISSIWRKKLSSIGGWGYRQVALMKNKQQFTKKIHRLIAESFIQNKERHPLVLHKDGNKLNNNVDNLYWGTQKMNHSDALRHGTHSGLHNLGERNGNAKLKDKDIVNIKNLKGCGLSYARIADRYGVCVMTIWAAVNRKTWKYTL